LGRSEGKGKASVSRDMWNFPANAIFWVCALKFQISGSVTFQGHYRDMLKSGTQSFALSPPHLGFHPHFVGILKSSTN